MHIENIGTKCENLDISISTNFPKNSLIFVDEIHFFVENCFASFVKNSRKFHHALRFKPIVLHIHGYKPNNEHSQRQDGNNSRDIYSFFWRIAQNEKIQYNNSNHRKNSANNRIFEATM